MWYLYLKSNYIIVFSNYNSEKTLLGERGLLEEHIAKCSSIWGKSCSKVYFILYLKYHLKEFGERRRDRILILSSNFWTLKQNKRLKKIWFKKKKKKDFSQVWKTAISWWIVGPMQTDPKGTVTCGGEGRNTGDCYVTTSQFPNLT